MQDLPFYDAFYWLFFSAAYGESPSIEFLGNRLIVNVWGQGSYIEIIIKARGLTPCGLLTAIEAAHANCRHIVRTAKANSKA